MNCIHFQIMQLPKQPLTICFSDRYVNHDAHEEHELLTYGTSKSFVAKLNLASILTKAEVILFNPIEPCLV